MTHDELGAVFFLVGCGVMFVIAVRVFGLRRVLRALGMVVLLAVTVALKTLGAVTGGRRY